MMSLHKFCENIRMIATNTVGGNGIDLNDLGNLAMYRFARKLCFSDNPPMPELSSDEAKALADYWKPFLKKQSDAYYRRYKGLNIPFDPRYIPEDMMFMYIDRYFSDREAAKYEDDKCRYYKMFPGIPAPKAYAFFIGGKWFDENYMEISREQAVTILKTKEEVVVKVATSSECGLGVSFYKGEEITDKLLAELEAPAADLVAQEVICQHADIAKLHPNSVNCLRIDSLILDGEVKICAVVLKIGQKESRVDNTHSGAVFIGVTPTGHLMDKVYTGDNRPLDKIPDFDGDFRGMAIPGFDSAIELVKKAHLMVPKFGFIGWDVAIDASGLAVLVEPNFSISGVFEDQLCCGPLFGEDTPRVLREVFPKQKRSLLL